MGLSATGIAIVEKVMGYAGSADAAANDNHVGSLGEVPRGAVAEQE